MEKFIHTTCQEENGKKKIKKLFFFPCVRSLILLYGSGDNFGLIILFLSLAGLKKTDFLPVQTDL